jgi:hypothetical protein
LVGEVEPLEGEPVSADNNSSASHQEKLRKP